MTNTVQEILRLPVASSFAGLFYVLLIAVIFSKQSRDIFTNWLQAPSHSSQRHLGGLDAFRGIAALGAATFHTLQWSSPYFSAGSIERPIVLFGFKSVPIFVVLSGFLIYRAVIRISSVEQLTSYGRNRFYRVYPLYAATVFASLVFGMFHLNEMLKDPGCVSPLDSTFHSGIPAAQHFIAELFMLHGLGFSAFVNPPSWSLYTEVLFYMALPFFVFLVRKRMLLAACIGIIVFSLTDFAGPREFMLWKYFFFGIASAEIHHRLQHKISQGAGATMFFLGVALVYIEIVVNYDWVSQIQSSIASTLGVHWLTQINSPAPYFTVGLGFSISLLMLGAIHSSIISRTLSFRPFEWLATISFSVFMWHGFLLVADLPVTFCGNGVAFHFTAQLPEGAAVWVLPLIMIPSILMIGVLSYVMIERPFLMLKRKTRR